MRTVNTRISLQLRRATCGLAAFGFATAGICGTMAPPAPAAAAMSAKSAAAPRSAATARSSSVGMTLDALDAIPQLVGGSLISLEVRGTDAEPVVEALLARDGFLTRHNLNVVDGTLQIDADEARYNYREVPAKMAKALSDSPALLSVVRQALAVAPGFYVLEAEYEHEDGRWLASIELTDGGNRMELLLEPSSGKVVKIERDDDDDDHDDHDDHDHDDNQ